MNDNDFKKLFEAHKIDRSDDGFLERVVRQLPERKSLLPQMVMIAAIIIGFTLTFAMPGFTTCVLEQIYSLTASINQLQAPTASAIITYFGLLTLLGTVGYSVAQVDLV